MWRSERYSFHVEDAAAALVKLKAKSLGEACVLDDRGRECSVEELRRLARDEAKAKPS